MKRGWVVVIVVALVAVAAWWWWWRRRQAQTSTSVGGVTVVQTNPKPPTFAPGEPSPSGAPIGAVDVSGVDYIPITGPLGVGIGTVTYYDGMLLL